jgi:inorganic pyrophosphatase
MKTYWSFLFFAVLVYGCQPEGAPADPASYAARTPNGINVVVEIPAGTNLKTEYQKDSGSFEANQSNGKPRIIDFLPYPGNYGFIPSTLMDKAAGGDGDPVDVMLLCGALPTGTVVEARPIGALQLLDEGELDTKVIAVPTDATLQTITPADFTDFSIRYDGARHIIETWFLYYDGLGTNTFEGWLNEAQASMLIEQYEQ